MQAHHRGGATAAGHAPALVLKKVIAPVVRVGQRARSDMDGLDEKQHATRAQEIECCTDCAEGIFEMTKTIM